FPLVVEVAIDFWRNFRGFDLAAAAPENVGVFHRYSDISEMGIDGRLVFEDAVPFCPVNDSHDVDSAEAGATLTPVAMGHDEVPSHFRTGLFLHPLGNFPMEKSIETSHTLTALAWLDVLEKSGETTYNSFTIKFFADFIETFEVESDGFSARTPRIFTDFSGSQLLFQCEEDFPFVGSEFHCCRCGHFRRPFGTRPRLHRLAAHVTDSQRENAVGRHEDKLMSPGEASEEFGVLF